MSKLTSELTKISLTTGFKTKYGLQKTEAICVFPWLKASGHISHHWWTPSTITRWGLITSSNEKGIHRRARVRRCPCQWTELESTRLSILSNRLNSMSSLGLTVRLTILLTKTPRPRKTHQSSKNGECSLMLLVWPKSRYLPLLWVKRLWVRRNS